MQSSSARALCGALALLWFGTALAAGQAESLGDVARRECERRAKAPAHPVVLTNEDLQREKILPVTPAAVPDAAAVPSRAATAVAAPPSVQAPPLAAPFVITPEAGVSLGEYARRVRQEKARARERRAAAAAERESVSPSASAGMRVAAAPQTLRIAPRALMPQPSPATHAERATRSGAAAPHSRAKIAQAPVRPGAKGYRLRRGDSLWKIARALFGDARLWKEIWKTNPEIANPNRVRAGKLVRLPGESAITAARLRFASRRVAVAATHGPRSRSPHSVAGAPLAQGASPFAPRAPHSARATRESQVAAACSTAPARCASSETRK